VRGSDERITALVGLLADGVQLDPHQLGIGRQDSAERFRE
jgi:hypothetical protein